MEQNAYLTYIKSNNMKLMISGSREANSAHDAQKLIEAIEKQNAHTILHGGAVGADAIANRYAETRRLVIIEIKPDYAKNGKAATHMRNDDLLKLSDKVICYYATTYPNRTAGTFSVAQKAKKQGKLIAEIWRNGEPQTLF
jgi:predicted Rossmann-fold nucleotide-binding protein